MIEELSSERRSRLVDFIAPFRVAPGRDVVLGRDYDPAYKADVKNKKQGKALLEEGVELLST
jgi:hypothetical protein